MSLYLQFAYTTLHGIAVHVARQRVDALERAAGVAYAEWQAGKAMLGELEKLRVSTLLDDLEKTRASVSGPTEAASAPAAAPASSGSDLADYLNKVGDETVTHAPTVVLVYLGGELHRLGRQPTADDLDEAAERALALTHELRLAAARRREPIAPGGD